MDGVQPAAGELGLEPVQDFEIGMAEAEGFMQRGTGEGMGGVHNELTGKHEVHEDMKGKVHVFMLSRLPA